MLERERAGHLRMAGLSTEGWYDLIHHGRADHPGYAELVVSVGRSTGPMVVAHGGEDEQGGATAI